MKSITKTALLASVSLVTLHGAYAAAPTAQSADLEQITVSATRVEREGFEAPTPVTVLGREQITEAMVPHLGDYLSNMPAFGAAMGPRNPTSNISSGNTGLSLVNLRNLGTLRTLVLFNGQRVVSATIANSGVDMSLIPTSLVERVDVVTGGASAAWGSDAVSGVVNIILNKNYTGLEANVEGSVSSYWDSGSYRAGMTGGTPFANGRGHVVGSVEYTKAIGLTRVSDRPWWKGWLLVENPAFTATNSEPRLIRRQTGIATGTIGGIITAGPLKGTQFIGPNGTPAPFDYGILSGQMSTGPDADRQSGSNNNFTQPNWRANTFGYATYDVTDDIRASLEIEYSHFSGKHETIPYGRYANITVQRDNAFLDPGIRQRMVDLNITNFQFGTTNVNLGYPGANSTRRLFRSVITLDGNFGDGWTWDAYSQRGRSEARATQRLNPYVARYNAAIDAVRAPNGQIQCRVNTDANTANDMAGCTPLNIFGVGVASKEAINYVAGIQGYQLIRNWQNVVAGSVSGEPFSTWAGPVSFATGLEWRKESAAGIADALSIARSFYAGNPQNFKYSAFNVKEAFGETVIPLAKDTAWARNLDFNGAVRVTDYSTSGVVVTWKAGATYQIVDDFRLRGTRSRDIRAPNLSELSDQQGITTTASTFDPFTGATGNVANVNNGNPNLQPEKANTWSLGGVYSPGWLEGFQTSVDWYSIRIKDAIFTTGSVQIIDQCFRNLNPRLCPRIVRDASGALTRVNVNPENIATAKTSGIDYEMSYRTRFYGGDVNLRFLGTYYLEQASVQNAVYLDNNGAIGSNTGGPAGYPKVRITASVGYNLQPITASLDARMLSKSKLNNNWGPKDVDDNTVPAIVYFDLRSSYTFDVSGTEVKATMAIDNLLNQDPPIVAASYQIGAPFYNFNTNVSIYDAVGRTFRVGLRAKF